jgi:hypothetical protein
MNWWRYREFQGNGLQEVVLAFDPADRDSPFLDVRAGQYRKTGKVVRLLALRPNPSDRERTVRS